MSGRVTDDGLSEVIGFILIIAIIVILGSLYMTYVVPSQGRDAEIQHMQTVEKFFTDFKMNIDSLWLNNQVGVSFNEIFQLGTGGQTSTGAFSIFPIMQPVSSFGTIRVTHDNPILTLKINGLWVANESTLPDKVTETQVADPNTLLVVNYDTGITETSVPDTLVVYSTNGDWTATFEIVNETFLLPGDIRWNVTPQGYVTNLSFSKDSQNALAVTISKNGYKTLDRMRINSTMGDIKGNYTINLLDEAYGLHNDVIFPFGVNYTYYRNGFEHPKKNPFQLYGYNKTERVTEIHVGTFSYESSNKYWINQNYQYTLGGVFLDQNGIQTYRTKPWISMEQKPGYEGGPPMIPDVNLNILRISQIAGNMSGPDNVQISSKLLNIDDAFEDINEHGRGFHLANLRPNAAYVYINITNRNPDFSWGNSWNQTLYSLVRDSGIPLNYYTPPSVKTDASGCTVSLLIHGYYNTGSGGALDTTPDLFVNYENIESEISISGPVYV